MDRLERGVRIRLRCIGLCFIVVCVAIVVRSFQFQVLATEQWRAKAERQYQKVIPLAPQRGAIYDRKGEALAVSLEVDSLFLEPQRVSDVPRTASALSSALELPYDTVKNKLSSGKNFVWLKRQLTPQESGRIDRKLPGIGFAKEHQRFYPNAQLAGQMLGFTGLDPDGLEGLELKYNDLLLGQGGYLVTEKDNLGRAIGAGSQKVEGAGPGGHLVLTIDKNVQYIAEKELAQGVLSAGAKAGCVVILEPATGRVLAMASMPDFNPNAVSRYRPANWRNRVLSDTYEPGSTFKVFVLAAALNEGVVKPYQYIDCEMGSYSVGGKVIHDHSPHGAITVSDILKYSSNIGFAKIGKKLERQRLHHYLTEFGFGAPSGVDLPGETTGLLRKPKQWFEIDLAAISFGQGVTVTPMQVATAMTAIANGGNLMQPYLVEKVVDGFGEVIEEHQPKVVRQVVSREVANSVRDMMMTVTEQGGTGTLAVVPGYRTAGKTGTAQKADPVSGGYSKDKRVASFVGFIPAENPKLVMLVMLDEPTGQVYGGLIAAPIFSRIASQTLQYLGVPPNIPDGKNQILPSAEQIAKALEAARVESEAPPVVDIDSIVAAEVDGETIVAPVASGPLMPDFVGMSARQVLQVIEKDHINVRLIGSGRVIEQEPAAGAAIPAGSEIWVKLEPPT